MSALKRANKSSNTTPPTNEAMGFLDHLEELRKRLWRIILILITGTVISLIFADQLIAFLIKPFIPNTNENLALLYPTEGFIVRIKTSFVAGIFLTTPLWFSQIWGFISPALFAKEKRIIAPIIALSSLMFLIGAVFGWYVLPFAIKYFQSLTLKDIAIFWSLGKYIDFTLRLLLAFGIVFELPLIVFLVARLGIVTTEQLRKYRRHTIVAFLILASIITPPDVVTQIILTLPLILLYEVGILAAKIANKKRVAL